MEPDPYMDFLREFGVVACSHEFARGVLAKRFVRRAAAFKCADALRDLSAICDSPTCAHELCAAVREILEPIE